jgi:hypothetical protein
MRTPTLDVLVLLAIALPTGQAAAQDPKPEPAAPADLDAAITQLRNGSWLPAYQRLQQLAGERQQAVLERVAPIARQKDDVELAARARVVLDAVIRDHAAAEKRAELRERFRRVRDAEADVRAALGGDDAAARKAAATALQQSVAALQESVASDAALNPQPLRVPLTAAPEPKPAAAAADGYRKIEVDGKTMLVPAEALPEGTEYEAEMTEQGLVIKKKRKAKPAEKKAPKSSGRPDR